MTTKNKVLGSIEISAAAIALCTAFSLLEDSTFRIMLSVGFVWLAATLVEESFAQFGAGGLGAKRPVEIACGVLWILLALLIIPITLSAAHIGGWAYLSLFLIIIFLCTGVGRLAGG